MRSWLSIVLLGLALGHATPAWAKHNRFLGPHPVAVKLGGGYCYIEVPHIHAYAPDRPGLYQEHEGNLVFAADPTPFGYDGPKFTFYGHHPIVGVPGAGVYCYLDGPHYHPYAPPETPEYKVDNGVAFYVGAFQPVYYKEKPRRAKMFGAEYRPFAAARPVVEVQPPPEYHGDVWVPPPPAQVELQPGSPQVVVQAPQPQVVVSPPRPQVVVTPPRPVIVAAPPRPVVVAPPAPHVIVAPPAPHVIVAPPAPHVIVGPAPVYVGPGRVKFKGKHKGWGHGGWGKPGKHKGWGDD